VAGSDATPFPVTTVPSVLIVPDLVAVPGGWFTLGSNDGRPDERPPHRVYVRACAAGRTPVTNSEYSCFVAAGQQEPKFWGDPRLNVAGQPVVGVPWAAAAAYCTWLSERTGRRFRLPTEAEWEHAALAGGDGLRFPWGDTTPAGDDGISLADRAMDGPAPAGSGPVNALGIFDMCWNIHEWCSDWYSATYYAESPDSDPRGPERGVRRASRGGAWRHQMKISRCAARSSIPPAFEYADYGFRVFAELAETEQ
jgi:formylglycine-generating enzyme